MTLQDFSIQIAPYGFVNSKHEGQSSGTIRFTKVADNLKQEISLYVMDGKYTNTTNPSFIVYRKYNDNVFEEGSMKFCESYQQLIAFLKEYKIN